MATPPRTGGLTAQHRVRAALAAIADGGSAAVSVEPLARTFGATRGASVADTFPRFSTRSRPPPGVPLYAAYGFTEGERVGVTLAGGPTVDRLLMDRAVR